MFKNFQLIFLLVLFIGNFFLCFSQKENLKTHLFSFKGFEIKLLDFAQDEIGNYLFVGTIKVTEMLAANRDSLVNRKLGYGKNVQADFIERGVMIYTDSNFEFQNIKTIKTPYKVIFDKDKQVFYVGTEGAQELTNVTGYEMIAKSALEILEVRKDLDYKSYSISSENKLYLKQFIVQNDHLFIIADEVKFQKLVLFDANLNLSERNSLNPYNSSFARNYSFSKLDTTDILHEDNLIMEVFEISKVKETYYFCISSFDQKSLNRSNHFYKYSSGKVELLGEINVILEKFTKRNSNIIVIYFKADLNDEISIFFLDRTKKGELFFLKLNKNLEVIYQNCEVLEKYLDFNKIVFFDNPSNIILTLDQNKLWSFQFRNAEMKLIKVISTSIDESFYPIKSIKAHAGNIEVLFSDFEGKSLISVIEN